MTQRVIKFRRAFFNYDGSFYGFREWGPVGGGFVSPAYVHGCKSGEDQQFTGMTDKHGKEIYEHDILKVDDDYDKYGWAAGMIGRVIFDKGKYMLSDGTSRFFFEDNQMSYVERLGDIYITPELVEP